MADTPPTYTLASDDDDRPPASPAGEKAAAIPRRRRRLFLLLAAVLVVCVAAPVVVFIGWVAGQTVKASKGAPSPDAALVDWMYSFRDPTAVDADRYVLPERRAELARVRDAFLAQLRQTAPGARVEVSSIAATETIDGDRATVTDHYLVSLPLEGTVTSVHTRALAWTAEARRSDGGWRLWTVSVPPWCGSGGYVPQCGPPAAKPTASASPSPSDDLLQNPRDMLRCGPKDPFRTWHDCPSASSATPHG
jgi:hypothetical protein